MLRYLYLCPALLFTLGILNLSQAQTQPTEQATIKPLVHLTFDDEIPGTEPKQWKHIWGQLGKDRMLIANLDPLHDQGNHLLIQRLPPSDTPEAPENAAASKAPQWGAGIQIPSWDSPWLEVRFAFRHEGPLMDHVGRFELRGLRNEDLYAISMGTHSMNYPATSGKVVLKCQSQDPLSVIMSKVDANQWYRMCIRIPAPTTDAKNIYALLQSQDKQDNWINMGTMAVGSTAQLDMPVRVLRLSLPPGIFNKQFTLALDEIMAIPVEQGHFDLKP